jgi:mono/diheme cytochrome c family protein
MKTMFRIILSVVFVSSLSACVKEQRVTADINLSDEELIKRGYYLTTIGACHDCHSPKIMTPTGPEPDPSRLFSGHPMDVPTPEVTVSNPNWVLFEANHFTAFVGPWGISYAANLTPDETGTGNWTLEQFKTAIRKGKYKGLEGSRDLLPPMPWQMYRNFTDEDLTAIFAYLQTVKPVHNIVPAPISTADLLAKK